MKTPTVVLALAFAALMGRAQAAEFTVTSPDLASGFAAEQVLSGFGCTGGNVSPAVSWSGAPEGTKSFVVTLYDKDAPTGSGWWHWVVADVPASVTSLPHGAGTDPAKLPAGARQTPTDGGAPGYMGPCPPKGSTHAYTITVTALKVAKLELPPAPTAALVGFMTNMNALGRASLTISHGR